MPDSSQPETQIEGTSPAESAASTQTLASYLRKHGPLNWQEVLVCLVDFLSVDFDTRIGNNSFNSITSSSIRATVFNTTDTTDGDKLELRITKKPLLNPWARASARTRNRRTLPGIRTRLPDL